VPGPVGDIDQCFAFPREVVPGKGNRGDGVPLGLTVVVLALAAVPRSVTPVVDGQGDHDAEQGHQRR